jgi:hypothetical protein
VALADKSVTLRSRFLGIKHCAGEPAGHSLQADAQAHRHCWSQHLGSCLRLTCAQQQHESMSLDRCCFRP